MSPGAPRSVQLILMLGIGAIVGLGIVLLAPGHPTRPQAPPVQPTPGAVRLEQEAAQVLRLWDGARAAAWATGDTKALRRLYVDGSRAGRADVALLARWRDRGLRVFGITMQVVRLDVIDHAAGRWRLRVTDRLAAADVVGPGVEAELIDPEMPSGAARTRVLELREQDGTWRMALVRARS